MARIALSAVVVVGLAIDAYVHFHLASNYDPIKTSVLSQGELFRAEGVVSVLAALALLVRPRRYTAAISFAVAASALVVLLAYRYINISAIGPIPSMYEPVWFAQKTLSGFAEAVAALASLALFFTMAPQKR